MRKGWQRWGIGLGCIVFLVLVGQRDVTVQQENREVSGPVGIELAERSATSAESADQGSSVVTSGGSTTTEPSTTNMESATAAPGIPVGPPIDSSPRHSPSQVLTLPADDPSPDDLDEPVTTESHQSSPTFQVGGEERKLVVAVIDGGTIELEGGERIRYIGIDTPESTTEHECYGEEAKQRNREIVEGVRVRLEFDVEQFDKYGRTLAYVYVGDLFINEALVAQGFASTLTIPPNVKFADRFAQLAAAAREQGKGLWSACGGNESNSRNSSRPGYDETIPQASVSDCPPDRPIKGNAQSKIYHVPGGDFYAKTKPEECFATEEEAAAAGYRKSKR